MTSMPTAFMHLSPAFLEALKQVAPKRRLPRPSFLVAMSIVAVLAVSGAVAGFPKRVSAAAHATEAPEAESARGVESGAIATPAPPSAPAFPGASPAPSQPALPAPAAVTPLAVPAPPGRVVSRAPASNPRTSNTPRKPHRRTTR